MRRQDIQLRTLARQGDVSACCEVGRRYLLGVDGFHQHVQAGIEYLTRPGMTNLPQATRVIAESLPLETILELGQQAALLSAAQSGSAA
ncbi:MAG: hypothetical protein JWP52_3492, partial [Rhizobacter sp.]|nr:hypothetical protein [Rhizobacter sp.]